jgi:Holliday junction DNA helicase RuvA
MIASLRGMLTELEEGACVVEVHGVGYQVQVSAHTSARLGSIGQEVRLRTRQIVREDSVQLFGFSEPDEARLFDLLISVNGVGPRLALAALSGLDPVALAVAIRDEQIERIVSVPGIGRKTAERLIIELRDKLGAVFAGAGPPARGSRVLPADGLSEDAAAALVTLGYAASAAQEAVREARAESPDAGLETVVRSALLRLSRPSLIQR